MKVESTVYYQTDSERIQLNLPNYTVSALKWLGDGNRFTKGVVAYEVLLQISDEYTDELTDLEDYVDEEFSSVYETSASDVELKIITASGAHSGKEYLIRNCEYESPEETAHRSNLHIPTHLYDQMPHTRGLGETLTHALVQYAESPWDSRRERIRTKKQLIAYKRDGEMPTDVIAKKIVNGVDDFTEINEYLFSEDSVNWYDEPDVTVEEVRTSGTDISQKNMEKRIEVLQRALENDRANERNPAIYVKTPSEVEIIVSEAFGVGEQTAKKYADKIDYWWLYEGELLRLPKFEDKLKYIKKDAMEQLPDDSKGAQRVRRKVSNWTPERVCGLPADIGADVSEMYFDAPEGAINTLTNVRDECGGRTQYDIESYARDELRDYIDEEIARLE